MALSAGIPDTEPVNLTPMIDVVFNLLIFFLLSATYLNEDRELELSLPTVKSAAPAVSAPKEIVVVVHEDGKVRIDKTEYDAEELEKFLIDARKNYPDQAVSIRGDESARYQWVADVLAICRQAGIRRISAVVQER